MVQRMIPDADPLTGEETFFGIQLGKWRRFKMSIIKGKDGINGTNGRDGRDGLSGTNGANGKDGTNGKDGAPKRVEQYTAITDANGIATFTFNPVFTSTPDVGVVIGWSGEQMISGAVLTRSITGASVQAMTSRGTLALSAGPFTKAGAGLSVTVRVIGN